MRGGIQSARHPLLWPLDDDREVTAQVLVWSDLGIAFHRNPFTSLHGPCDLCGHDGHAEALSALNRTLCVRLHTARAQATN